MPRAPSARDNRYRLAKRAFQDVLRLPPAAISPAWTLKFILINDSLSSSQCVCLLCWNNLFFFSRKLNCLPLCPYAIYLANLLLSICLVRSIVSPFGPAFTSLQLGVAVEERGHANHCPSKAGGTPWLNVPVISVRTNFKWYARWTHHLPLPSSSSFFCFSGFSF